MRRIYIILILFLFSRNVFSQSVGLVLSGGGAKGLYHIGMIKALEENEIPIDYISGTSMGSIIAGLYAAGYTPDQMAEVFKSKDVEYWLNGKFQEEYSFFYKQLQPKPSMLSLDINVGKYLYNKQEKKGKTLTVDADTLKSRFRRMINITNPISSPASIIPSTQMDIAFMYFFASASAYANNCFDSLFVPFRCVSVDIFDRKEVVWSKGDLGMAIRSSMAIPLVFKPVKVDSMMMYDGGLLNNFPWQTLEEDFNPDVIIGGKCSGGTTDISTIQGQIEMLIMSKTDYDLPKEKGIMIERNVEVGYLDFKKVDYVVMQGYNDAMAVMPQIKASVERRVTTKELYAKRLAFKKKLPELIFNKVNITGLSSEQRQYAINQINTSYKNKDVEVSFEEFKTEYFKILSENIVEGDFPTTTYNDTTGGFELNLNIVNKPSMKALVGFNITSSSLNQGYIGLQYQDVKGRASIYTLDGHLGSFYNAVQLGTRHNFYKRRDYYFEGSFAYNFFDYARGNSQRYSYKFSEIRHLKYNDVYLSGLIGFGLDRFSKFELRAAIGYDMYSYFLYKNPIPSDSPDRSKYRYFTANATISRNSLNYLMYPTRGISQSLSVYGIYTGEDYSPGSMSKLFDHIINDVSTRRAWGGVHFSRNEYFNLVKHFTLGYSVDALYSNQPDLYNEYMTNAVAPAFSPTPTSKTLFLPSFRSDSYVALGVQPIFEVNNKLYIKGEAYAYLPNIVNMKNLSSRIRYIASAAVVYQSPIGPVSFSYSYFDDQFIRRDYFVFSLGYSLFNKKGIVY